MKSLSALVLSLALLLVGGATQAATLTADCSNPSTNLQTVINSAAPGDTIMVNGTCKGQFTISRPLTLEGVASTSGATLDGNQGGSVLTVNATSDTVTLNDLIITNGTGTRVFEANTAGGGIYHTGASTLTLNEVTVRLNQAGSGSGIDNEAGSLILTHSSVNHNQCCASGLTGSGGGILMNGGDLSLTSSSVSHNQTVAAGGGISNNGTQVTLSSASLRGNVVKAGGGGGIWNGGTLTIHRVAS
jgi:nitrous oxidase accessory protein NosD